MTSFNAIMGKLVIMNLSVYLLSNDVMVSLTALEEMMNWTTTVPVNQRELFVWWMVLFLTEAELKSVVGRDGELFVVADGIPGMLLLFVAS